MHVRAALFRRVSVHHLCVTLLHVWENLSRLHHNPDLTGASPVWCLIIFGPEAASSPHWASNDLRGQWTLHSASHFRPPPTMKCCWFQLAGNYSISTCHTELEKPQTAKTVCYCCLNSTIIRLDIRNGTLSPGQWPDETASGLHTLGWALSASVAQALAAAVGPLGARHSPATLATWWWLDLAARSKWNSNGQKLNTTAPLP